MERHAYLVMAHQDYALLRAQLRLLDDERNDLYVHVDSKARGFDARELRTSVHRARLELVERTDVRWGAYSQTATQLRLLERAARTPHRYYHLLSGADLPLVSQEVAHAFFTEHDGAEFVHIHPGLDAAYARRVLRRHLFSEQQRTPVPRAVRVAMGVLDGAYGRWQDATRSGPFAGDDVEVRKGANWFSITHALACYVLEHRDWIAARYGTAMCGDESYLQTLVWASPFRTALFRPPADDYRGCLRKIDWHRSSPEDLRRGSPYIWRSGDFAELRRGFDDGFLFARKFSTDVDAQVVEQLVDLVSRG